MAIEIGIIGGSGFYRMPDFTPEESVAPDTPFGAPSGKILVGRVDGVAVGFVPRHGAGHHLTPSAVPYRANMFALKVLGAHTVIGVNAVGSLHLSYAPGHLAVPDDLYDRTHARERSFFESGLVAHVGLAEPFCRGARQALLSVRDSVTTTVHDGGSILVVEGPRFSTRAESALHRAWGFRLIGMTTMPEAALAREAEMCYAAVSVVTDYDVWHATEEAVTADAVMRAMAEAVRQAQALVRAALGGLAARAECGCRNALQGALATEPEALDRAMAERLRPIVGRYISEPT